MRAARSIADRKVSFLLFVSFASLLSAAHTSAQRLPRTEVEAGIEAIARLIEDNYVFPRKGRTIAANFSSARTREILRHAKDWPDFAVLASGVLREVSGDGHLYVRYDPQQAGQLKAPPKAGNSDEGPGNENSFFHGPKAREGNYGFTKLEVIDGNVGYLKLSQINFSDESLPVLFASMRFLARTKALIIDLRDNGGGGSEIGPVLESYFLPKDVVLLEFRNRDGKVEASKTVSWLTEGKYERPLYIIINKKTGSAAEAFAYALQSRKRAVIVGQPSAGAAHMSSWYPVNDHLYVSVSTGAPVLPGTETSWEGEGVQPDLRATANGEIELIKSLIAK